MTGHSRWEHWEQFPGQVMGKQVLHTQRDGEADAVPSATEGWGGCRQRCLPVASSLLGALDRPHLVKNADVSRHKDSSTVTVPAEHQEALPAPGFPMPPVSLAHPLAEK